MNHAQTRTWAGIAAVATLATLLTTAAAGDLGRLDNPPRAETHRVSSHDPNWENGNGDARNIAPGSELTLAEIEGPGRITHIWFTIASQARRYPRLTTLRIYYDGSGTPAVEAPLGDFFAVGHGMSISVNSAPVATSSFGRAYNCYWRMPFRKSVKVTMSNESKDNTILFWYIDYERKPVADDVPYFHAQYRQEYPADVNTDYLIADITGRGHYVGTVLSVQMSHPGRFGEGDDRFFVDGATTPTLAGTGTEDYFCDAWGFRTLNRPYYGITVWEGMQIGGRCTAYRWHVHDPVFFEKSLKMTIEHKGNTFDRNLQLIDAYTTRRKDMYSSVAFWYQTGTAKRFATMPPAEERLVPARVLKAVDLVDTTPDYIVQHGGLIWLQGGEGRNLTVPFVLDEEEDCVLYLRVWPRGDAGIYDVYVDDRLVLSQHDFFEEHHHAYDQRLDFFRLPPGEHEVRAVPRGKNVRATASHLFVDALVIEPVGQLLEPDAP